MDIHEKVCKAKVGALAPTVASSIYIYIYMGVSHFRRADADGRQRVTQFRFSMCVFYFGNFVFDFSF